MSDARNPITTEKVSIENYSKLILNTLMFLKNPVFSATAPIINKFTKDLSRTSTWPELHAVFQRFVEAYPKKISPLIKAVIGTVENKEETENLERLAEKFYANLIRMSSDIAKISESTNTSSSHSAFFSNEKKSVIKQVKLTKEELLLSDAKSDLEMLVLKYIHILMRHTEKTNSKEITLHEALNNTLHAIAKSETAGDVSLVAEQLKRDFKNYLFMKPEEINHRKKSGGHGDHDAVAIKIAKEYGTKGENELDKIIGVLKNTVTENQASSKKP